MPFLIDGYNVYHAATKLSEEWSRITPSTMCEFIAQDMERLGDLATIVFDGARPRGISTEPNGFDCLKVIYSGPKSDADTLMEQFIQKNTAPRRLTVVSSDNRIRRIARRRKATSLAAPEYLGDLIKRLQQPPRQPKEPREKRHGVPEGQLNRWLELFGIDPDQPPDDTDTINF